jgi:hypothetical protein
MDTAPYFAIDVSELTMEVNQGCCGTVNLASKIASFFL